MLSYDEHDIETPLWDSAEKSLNHGIIVSNLSFLLARKMGMDDDFCYDMAVAGMIHDIGKLKIYAYMQQKLDTIMGIDEARYIRMHPTTGYAILKEQGFNDRILSAVLHHHENYDGSGYPNNLRGDDIPLEGRILHVCDCFGALLSNRGYRDAFDLESALEVMIDEVKNFDMYIYLTFQEMVFSKEFKFVLNNLEIE